MNPTTKNLFLAGVISLMVAIAVVFGAKALTPPENSGVSSVVVTAPDGSVIGQTAPIRMASSGPPVPACSIQNTVLTCEGTGTPFSWAFPVGGGDSGIANEAFGPITFVPIDAGTVVAAKATLTPSQTGEIAITSSLVIPDSGCDAGGTGYSVGYVLHGADASAGTLNFVSAATLFCISNGTVTDYIGNASAAVSGFVADGGTSYDYVVLFTAGPGGSSLPDSSVGGIWVHEVP